MIESLIKNLLSSTKGFFASEWLSSITLIKEAFDIVQLSSSSSSSKTNNQQENNNVTSLIQLLEFCLFHKKFQLALDPRGSGSLFEMLFELHYIMLMKNDNNNNNNNHDERVAKLFQIALSLPIGERSTKKIFMMLDSFAKKNSHCKKILSSASSSSSAPLFTKMTIAMAFSREEVKSWPLLNHFSDAASTNQLQWIRVLVRRLQNPLCFQDSEMFKASVSVVVRQMLSEAPDSELFHFASFLVSVFFSELSSSSSATTSNSNSSRKQVLLESMMKQLKSSMCVLIEKTESLASSLEERKEISAEFRKSCQLQSKIVAAFPILSSMIELVSSAIMMMKSSSSSDQNNDNDTMNMFSSLISRLKQTTKQLCKQIQSEAEDEDEDEDEESGQEEDAAENDASKKKKNNSHHIISFSWLLNLWVGVAANFFSSSSSSSSSNQQQQLLSDIKKNFRLPGKTATVAGVGDAHFFSQWALNEQLLFGETLLHPDIFKQATSSQFTQLDPSGTPILVRAAAELFQSQRAEGAAGTILERAVERTSFFGNDIAGTPFGVDTALWTAFADSMSEQNSSLAATEELEQRRRQALYGSSGLVNLAPVEETSRRVSQTPSDFYLWNLKSLSLGGGLVLPNSGVSNGGDVAWATVMRDVETARRSTIPTGETGNGASLPSRLPMQSLNGFPSLQDTTANPARLPLPVMFENSSSSSSLMKSADSSSSSTMVMPEFIFSQIKNNNNNNNVNKEQTTSSMSWQKMTSMPENSHHFPPQPNAPPETLNDVTGPQRLRPPQRFILDKTTSARLEREQAEEKRRSRRELLQSLANEAVGIVMTSPAETVQMLETLPEFLLRLTKSSILAQTTLMQTELEESLTSGRAPQNSAASSSDYNTGSKYLGGFRVPTTSWLMDALVSGK